MHSSNSLLPQNEYIEPKQQFRAAWISPFGGDEDLLKFTTVEEFKKNIGYILDTLQSLNMNTMIFHVRTHNDALYVSKLNPVSKYFAKVNFSEFNPIEYVITEAHKRGIDFHAWMNPYRIRSGNKTSMEELREQYRNYDNPAKVEKYILNGTDAIFLNPGLEIVRNFIADTIIEFLEKYDVEAIHFDDYFYFNMHKCKNCTIIDEADQSTYVDYINSHPECGYNASNPKDKANWRREQTDSLIKLLHEKIEEINHKENRHIQLGISPTGIYKNGDGVVTYDEKKNAITNGSKTKGGQEHFESYLYCDTLKWINNEWITYILPQSYWATDHPIAGYKNVMEWWDKVVKYKKVNLYSGVGLYMSDRNDETYGWKKNKNELHDQIVYTSSSENIEGISIYNFNTLRKKRDGKKTISAEQVTNAQILWQNKVSPSEIKWFEKIKPLKPGNISAVNNKITFDRVNDSKYYVIYRSEHNITFDNAEIFDYFKDNGNNSRVEYIDKNNKDNKDLFYGVKGLSYSNTFGEGNSIKSKHTSSSSNYLSVGMIMMIFSIIILLF